MVGGVGRLGCVENRLVEDFDDDRRPAVFGKLAVAQRPLPLRQLSLLEALGVGRQVGVRLYQCPPFVLDGGRGRFAGRVGEALDQLSPVVRGQVADHVFQLCEQWVGDRAGHAQDLHATRSWDWLRSAGSGISRFGVRGTVFFLATLVLTIFRASARARAFIAIRRPVGRIEPALTRALRRGS